MNATFTKIMMLTTSSNDSEALAALRKANNILREPKVSWEELLNATAPKPADQSFRTPPSQRKRPAADWNDVNSNKGIRYTDEDEINPMFEKAFANNNSAGFGEFLSSIHIWWTNRGWLSEKQYDALKRSVERE